MCKKQTMGYIKLFRKIQDWGWYDDPNTLALWVHLLVDANWKDNAEWHGEPIERGALITSVAKISADTGLTDRQVRTALSHLVSTGEIVMKTTNKWTKITICKYDTYQSSSPDECQTDDEQPTSKRQTTDKQATTLEESKKGITEESKKGIDVQCSETDGDDSESKPKKKQVAFVKPTVKEISDFCKENNINIDPDYFYDYYESNGWKVGGKSTMKDWQATVRNWGRRQGDRGQQGLFMGQDDDATAEEKADWLNGRRPQRV